MPDPTIPAAMFDRLDLVLHRLSETFAVEADGGIDGDTDGGTGADLPSWELITEQHPGWRWLRASYGLDETELDVLLLALAPEVDLRYARRLARLQDDPGSCRPTVDLVLRLLAPLPERLAARALFRTDGALLANRLIALEPDPRLIAPVLPTHHVVIDEQVVDVVLHQGGLDRRLTRCASLTRPQAGRWAQVSLPAGERDRLLAAARAAAGRRPWRLYLQGPAGSGQRTAAAALAGELGVPLLRVDLAAVLACPAPAGGDRAEDVLARAVREALLHGALLHVTGADSIIDAPAGVGEALTGTLADHPGPTVLSGSRAWVPSGGCLPGVISADLASPPFEVRRDAWRRELASAGADPHVAEDLAALFRAGPGPIADAVAMAVAGAGDTPPGRQELFAAARGRSAHHLRDLAHRIDPGYDWSNLVLPEDSLGQLHDLCRRVRFARTVWHDWGFERTIAHGRGVTALFAGPSGTGKTMAAEVIAAELGLELFAIDLSTVISKYIGETEKNLERIFTAAAEADAILMFDEADALFGKRSQVRDAHDRYANVETAYLLQRMERYPGVAVLATNLRTHLDEAFTRRLQFVVEFPFPDEAHRRRIWEVSFPGEAPRHPELDLDAFAREVRLAGGNIRNVALHAAFLAAADGGRICQEHVRAAVAHEYRKLGRVLPEALAPIEADDLIAAG